MLEKIKKNWLYRLLVINSLETIQNIDTLIEGLIVGAFGILFGLGGYLIFNYLGFIFSAAVSKLAFFAYLAVLLYHFVGYWREKRYEEGQYLKRGAKLGRIAIAIILTLFVYLWIIEQALYIATLFPEFRAVYGPLMLFLRALPGILILLLPLLGWEKLCKVTPVDEIVKWWFK